MSKAVNSPTARLLQSSRLFSLPRPLPAPDLSSSASSGIFKSSETATTPYPTHQAIATPASSLSRGDWGLKRSLPGRKLRGTKPTVRVRAQDTWEHVTSFESAGDHVRTLEKWNEMGIPMTIKPKSEGSIRPGNRNEKFVSVYEEEHDITDKDTAATQLGQKRWKYQGPWLGGMQEGEFQSWLLRQVGGRHDEWLEFLRERETERRVRVAYTQARNDGENLSTEAIQQLRETERPEDHELRAIQKRLRDEHDTERLGSQLTALITDFLDLPSVPAEAQAEETKQSDLLRTLGWEISSEKGPPSTHPGAGLSHLRTNAIMENHPIHGPQATRTPVQARVVRPRITAGASTEHVAKLGVGGVVADDTVSKTAGGRDTSKHRVDTDDVAEMMNPAIAGGGKMWVQPHRAWVDENGKIQIKLSRADHEAVAVKTGEVEEIHAMKRQAASDRASAKARSSYGSNYGTSLPDWRRMPQNPRSRFGTPSAQPETRRRPEVQGFDEELKGEEMGSGSNAVADILRRGL